jgi:hypothetical protein
LDNRNRKKEKKPDRGGELVVKVKVDEGFEIGMEKKRKGKKEKKEKMLEYRSRRLAAGGGHKEEKERRPR